jgi:multisubunit Na+/H+ antiporter MnhC subunit
VWKSAAFAAVLVVVVPLVLLTLTALVVGVAVFAVMSLIAAIARAFGGLAGGGSPDTTHAPTHGPERRENVRIIER